MSIISAVCYEFLRNSSFDKEKLEVLGTFLDRNNGNLIVVDDGLHIRDIYGRVVKEVFDKDLLDWLELLDREIESGRAVFKVTCTSPGADHKKFMCCVAVRGPERKLLVDRLSDYSEDCFADGAPELITALDLS